MTRSGRLKLNLFLIVVAAVLSLVAIFGIVLNILGYRYIVTDNGSAFYGKTSDGVVIKGTIVYADGSKAKIDRTLGTIDFENGDRYYGEFSGIYRHGNGKMTYAATGDTYEGEFTDDVINGYGVFKTARGDKYEGSFVNGKKDGSGIYTWSDGSSYEGGFSNNKKHGVGTYKYADGRTYTGDFVEDRKTGTGTFTYPDGDKYVGEFVNDVREGTGTYVYANGESYTGGFKNGVKHGHGIYTWLEPVKRSHEGNFVNGEIDMSGEEEAPETETEQ